MLANHTFIIAEAGVNYKDYFNNIPDINLWWCRGRFYNGKYKNFQVETNVPKDTQ